jgi:hypothetical protein
VKKSYVVQNLWEGIRTSAGYAREFHGVCRHHMRISKQPKTKSTAVDLDTDYIGIVG